MNFFGIYGNVNEKLGPVLSHDSWGQMQILTKEGMAMSTITLEALSSLVHDYIAAQAKRDAERDAERKKELAERKKEQAQRKKEQAERMKELEKQKAFNEMLQENHMRQKEDYDKRWKQLQQELGRLGNSYGDQVEAMFVNLGTKFNQFGYSFPKEAKGSIKFLGKDIKVLAEVDHLLENGSVIIPIEVKAKLKIDHVDDHVKRLTVISRHNETLGDNRKVIGAVAGGIVPKNVLEYAHKKGLYVIVQNGDSVEVANTPSGFAPQEW